MVPMLDESLDPDAPALLAYLSERIDAPGGLLGNLRAAKLVVRAKVAAMGVEGSAVPAQLAAAPELAGYVSDGFLMCNVAELDVLEDYVAGGAARRVRLAFAQPLEMSTQHILPPVGEELVAIARPPASARGRAVGEAVKNAFASEDTPVFMPPELGAELAW
ncbi:MAG: hypothetical protein KIT31_08285, partial [Deltaproteobacteria bacterium]|nr:hypothetical protein [Deltaproteobacteria bacterium]